MDDIQNHIKIADFGLATIVNESILTKKSSIVGTPGYMSPEQIRGENLTPQSDLFSLGIIAYELFSGKNPFVGKDINATINNILDFDENKVFSSIAHLPSDICSLIQRMLQKDTKIRLNSAGEILHILKDEPEPSRRLRSGVKLGSTISIIAVSVLALLIIIFVLNTIFKKDQIEEQPLITKEGNRFIEKDSVEGKDSLNLASQVQKPKSPITKNNQTR